MLVIDANSCPQNHSCPLIAMCPVEAISQVGFGLPVIDNDLCIECGRCESACPMGAVVSA